MKTGIIGLVFLGMMFTSCSNQEISSAKVPSVVLNSVQEKYPAAKEVGWKKSGVFYEAEIDLNDSIDLTVQVNEAGKLMMQKQNILQSEIPAAVLTTVQTRYKDYTIDDVEKLEKEGIVYYQLELQVKSKKDLNLVFAANGREEKTVSFWD